MTQAIFKITYMGVNMFTNKIFRSYLYCSGTRLDLLSKAILSRADAVTIDLEDSVPAAQKDTIRSAVVGTLQKLRPAKPIFVKINPLSSSYGLDDIEAVTGLQIQGVRVPKIRDVNEVAQIHDACLRNLFTGNLQLMLETASGIQGVDAIAKASSYTSLLIVGEEDLRNDLGCTRDTLDYSLSRVVVASRAAKLLPPVMSVWQFISDKHGLKESTMRGRKMGFWGRLCVHPSQVEVVNRIFTPERYETRNM